MNKKGSLVEGSSDVVLDVVRDLLDPFVTVTVGLPLDPLVGKDDLNIDFKISSAAAEAATAADDKSQLPKLVPCSGERFWSQLIITEFLEVESELALSFLTSFDFLGLNFDVKLFETLPL